MRIAMLMCLVVGLAGRAEAGTKVPITTPSNEARDLYVKGRDLVEKLRLTDGRKLYEQAVAKDKDFAMGYVGLATTAGTTKEFFTALERAVALSAKTTDGEKLLIEGLDAGARNDLPRQRDRYTKLVAAFPDDERAQMLLGIYYFNRQDYANAIKNFERAIAIDPKFSAPYNQLGYAYRFLERYPDAEKTFQKYVELIPNDPNPHDSYAELLMKTGRFDESIKRYEKALQIDPSFTASYIGIGNDQMFQGKYAAARATFGKLAAKARREAEQRQAIFWTAVSYLHESAWDKALAEADKLVAMSKKSGDVGQGANDVAFVANVLLEAGRLDAATAKFALQIEMVDKAELPPEAKATIKRNFIYNQARVALAKNDLAAAKALTTSYAREIGDKATPFEAWQHHELLGRIALAESVWKTAAAEFAKANQLDPRMLYMAALALDGAGDRAAARTLATKAADYNAFAVNFAYVRTKAKALAIKLK